MDGVEKDKLLTDAVWSYPCVYDVRDGEFKVMLVNTSVWKVIVGTAKNRHCTPLFAFVVDTTEAIEITSFRLIHSQFKY